MAERQKSEHKFAYLPFSCYNERSEKQAAAQQTFVFHKPLTNESPA